MQSKYYCNQSLPCQHQWPPWSDPWGICWKHLWWPCKPAEWSSFHFLLSVPWCRPGDCSHPPVIQKCEVQQTDTETVTNCILFCSTPELGALAPFVFEVCGPFYTCGVWPWHWFRFGFTSCSSCSRVPCVPLFHVSVSEVLVSSAIGSPE